MSLFSIKTAPVPLDAETYLGEKREYTQIIPETELIALTKNNYIPLTQAQISLCAKIGYMYYCEYAPLLKKCTEHTCMSAIYYDQGNNIKGKQCKTIVTFDTIPESKILDTGDLLICRASARPPVLSQLRLTFPPVWTEQGTEKAQSGFVRRSSIIKLHPQNQTRPNLARKASANQRPSHH